MAIAATSLTTLQKAKDYLKVRSETDDNLIERMVEAATDMIETFCGRQFASRTYTREIYDGSDGPMLLLNQYPITALTRVAVGRLDVIGVRNTSTDATRATVAVSATEATLTVVGGASASSNAVDWVTYTTLTAVVAQINALGSGWSAILQSSATGVYISTDIIPAGAKTCLGTYAYMEMPDPEGLSDYEIYWDEGMLDIRGSWGRSRHEIFVDYTAGYTMVPDDIEDACLELVAQLYHRPEHDSTLKSEKLGDYSYTVADPSSADAFPPNVMYTLLRYKDRRV